MRFSHQFLALILIMLAWIGFARANDSITETAVVMLQTTLGDIAIEVQAAKAPQTSNYFLTMIERGEYNGALFYRSGHSFVTQSDVPTLIQGGVMYDFVTGAATREKDAAKLNLLQVVETTRQTGLTHGYGTVSFARDQLSPNFVFPDIFICVAKAGCPEFDAGGHTRPDEKGYPAFGQVRKGLDVVEKISQAQTGGQTIIPLLKNQVLSEPVRITNAFLVAQ